MDDIAVKVALLTGTFALGFAGVAYASYAAPRGWPIGKWFASSWSLIGTLAIFSMLGAPIAAFILFPWVWGVGVVLIGFFLGFVLTQCLKSYVQTLTVLVLPVLWVADIIYVVPTG